MVARQSLSPGWCSGLLLEGQAFLSHSRACKNHRSVLDAASNDPEMCAFISICNPYICSPSCRLKTTKRTLQEMFELQTPYRHTEQVPVRKVSQQPVPRASRSAPVALTAALLQGGVWGPPRNTWAASLSPCCSQTALSRAKAAGDRGHGGSALLGWDAAVYKHQM